jgi:glycosyltransferase involved in cell wall biosynthesis
VLVEWADGGKTDPGKPLTILWPHRWEYDKNPEPFFDALLRLHHAGRSFKVVLVGQQFRSAPAVFSRICERLGAHIVHAGYIPDRTAYLTMLSGCDLVVSSAIQENFGIAVAEAVLTGCQPLLPARLAYPELIPPGLHDKCLYSSDARLFERLDALLAGHGILTTAEQIELQAFVEEQFGAARVCPRIDAELAEMVQNRGL